MSNPYDRLERVQAFTLTSSDVVAGAEMPTPQRSGIFGAGGDDISPQLSWRDVPDGTKSFIISMYDPKAPTPSGFWHWMVADVPADVVDLPTGAGGEGAKLPKSAKAVLNDAGSRRFIGAAPPAGIHHYYLAVHALDVENLGVDETTTPALLSFMSIGHVLGRALLVVQASAQALAGADR